MTLSWSPAQREWLQAMGFDVLGLAAAPQDDAGSRAAEAVQLGAPAALVRAARGVDLAPLLARLGPPRDVASRRAFWRALRPLRKASGHR